MCSYSSAADLMYLLGSLNKNGVFICQMSNEKGTVYRCRQYMLMFQADMKTALSGDANMTFVHEE